MARFKALILGQAVDLTATTGAVAMSTVARFRLKDVDWMMTANGRTSQPTPSKKLSSMPPKPNGQLSRYSIVPQEAGPVTKTKTDKRFGTRLQLIRRSPHKKIWVAFWLQATVTLTVDSDLNNCYSCRSCVMVRRHATATALTETIATHTGYP